MPTIRLLALLVVATTGCDAGEHSDDLGVDLGTANDFAVNDDLAAGPDQSAPADLGPDLALPPCGPTPDGGVWSELRCTGLYSDWPSRTIAPSVREFAPSYRLWSDGAQKRRWISLPPGSSIDVTDMNAWVFPVGTKLWKEFQVDVGGVQKRVETRLLWKSAPNTWTMTTYAWTSDETAAYELPGGQASVPGTNGYEIPAANSGGCTVCHNGRPDRVLGFEAVSLAEATPLGWNDLKSAGLLTSSNSNHTLAASSLLVPGNATEKPALGYLHANCGTACHHPGGPGPFSMRIDFSGTSTPADVQSTATFAAINATSSFTPSGGTGHYYRIRPTDPSRSTISFRMNVRGGYPQMPPVDTHVIDSAGLGAINAWITSMVAAPYPAPSPP